MRYKLLGRGGLRVSEVWLGTMTFGEDWGWGAPEHTAGRMLDMYLEAGGNVVDTADNYTNGASEEMLGRLMGSRRERIVVSTKYSSAVRQDDPNASGSHRRRLVEALETSLRRLQTDRIDVLWVHFRDLLTPVDETMRALDDQVRLGKVLYVGVSDWPAWEIAKANTLADLRNWTPFVGLQTQYSLLERTPERDLIPMAKDLQLEVVAWSPLARGMLSAKYLDGSASGRIGTAGEVEIDPRTEAIVREVVAVAKEIDARPAQVALAWLLSRSDPVIPILGATRETQLKENLATLDVVLTEEQRTRLQAVSAIELGFPHDWLGREDVQRVLYGGMRDMIID